MAAAGGTRPDDPTQKQRNPPKGINDQKNSFNKTGGKGEEKEKEAGSPHPWAGLPLYFWAGLTASSVGAQTLSVAYPLLAMALTGSPVQAGWVAFALTVPGLLCYLPAGVLVDRVSTRSLMLTTEALRVIAVGSVLVAVTFGVATVPHLLIAAAAEGTLWVLYSLAETTLIPSLARSSTGLLGALARSENSVHIAVLTGRPLGGFLSGVGQAAPFAVNLLLFVVSTVSIAMLPHRSRPEREKAAPDTAPRSRRLLRQIPDGLRELRRHGFLRRATLMTAVTNTVVNALIMIFIATSKELAAWEVGLVLAAGGVGGFLGTWIFLPLATRLASAPSKILTLQAWVWLIALGIAAFGPQPVNFALATLATGCAGAMSNITTRTFEAHHVDPAKLARVTSISRLVGRGAMSLGAPIGGLLIALVGAQPAILLLLAVTAGLVAIVTVSRRLGTAGPGGVRAHDRVTDAGPDQTSAPARSFTPNPIAYEG